MTDTLRDRIADIDEKHYQMLDVRRMDGGWLCACGHRFSGNTYREWRLHKADAVIAELGARQEWTYTWNDFESVGHGPPMSHDHAAAASAMVDGAIITRYVTDWITTESPRQPVEPWHGKAATYCVRCGIPHVTPCLREENR